MRFYCITDHDNRNSKMYFRVYKNRACMRRAAGKLNATNPCTKKYEPDLNRTSGVCFYLYNDDGHIACDIFLNEQDMGSGVVAHEIHHAVLYLYEDLYKKLASYKYECKGKHEICERLCEETEVANKMFWNWYLSKEKYCGC